jgi:hypothetical protein
VACFAQFLRFGKQIDKFRCGEENAPASEGGRYNGTGTAPTTEKKERRD